MKKMLSIVLSVCMIIMYSVPAFAYSSNDAVKVQLSDQAMAGAVGGTGTVQAQILERSGGNVTALVANIPNNVSCSYNLKSGMNSSGGGGTIVASGTIASGESKIVSAAATTGWYARISVDCSSGGIPGLIASSSTYVN